MGRCFEPQSEPGEGFCQPLERGEILAGVVLNTPFEGSGVFKVRVLYEEGRPPERDCCPFGSSGCFHFVFGLMGGLATGIGDLLARYDPSLGRPGLSITGEAQCDSGACKE